MSIVAAELLRAGMALGEALWQPLAQRPVLFFVGFMLTEPLTLPPRRWQQLALAAVVGLLFAVPYNLGFVANSPELALLVGNAARLPRRPARRRPAPLPGLPAADADDDGIQLPARAPGPLRAGTVHGTAPARTPEVRRERPAAGVQPDQRPGCPRSSRSVWELPSRCPPPSVPCWPWQPGDELTATTVGGDFVLPRRPAAPVLLIAAGIGITPVPCPAGRGCREGPRRCPAVPGQECRELAYAEELERSGARVIARLVRRLRAAVVHAGRVQFAAAGTDRRRGAEGAGSGHRRPRSLRFRLAGQRPFPPGRRPRRRCPADPRGLLCRLLSDADFPLEATFLLSSRTSRR